MREVLMSSVESADVEKEETESMADVRSLLRAERQARRITHPNASYTTDGKLSCNLCEKLVKSEASWQSHLHSTQHTLRSQRAQDAKDVRAVDAKVVNKKRKAESLDVESPAAQGKKRVRSGEDDGEDVGPKVEDDIVEEEAGPESSGGPGDPAPTAPPVADNDAPADADELEAFERDLAALEAESSTNRTSALQSAANISAAPMTAEQLAAQAREEASAQKGKRDQELEDEREDANRAMAEEFEEMEGLEERVRKLRERREALRKGMDAEGEEQRAFGGGHAGTDDDAVHKENDDDQDDEEDGWNFGGS
ncbi:uncharacterized protein LTR77_010330 [Saxophila tyrrhenica]|uniref:C2H2-type domain-containing protein n=1 Tax=Saxophila tyrrhenica TaxID=1690608 RepID=A0AAV9NW29_9PEZI|nr:hypothetical protein LTR77_010330 [Saxophila tyrrhenica]